MLRSDLCAKWSDLDTSESHPKRFGMCGEKSSGTGISTSAGCMRGAPVGNAALLVGYLIAVRFRLS